MKSKQLNGSPGKPGCKKLKRMEKIIPPGVLRKQYCLTNLILLINHKLMAELIRYRALKFAGNVNGEAFITTRDGSIFTHPIFHVFIMQEHMLDEKDVIDAGRLTG